MQSGRILLCHDMALELVCRTECWCNRYCKTSPDDLDVIWGQVWVFRNRNIHVFKTWWVLGRMWLFVLRCFGFYSVSEVLCLLAVVSGPLVVVSGPPWWSSVDPLMGVNGPPCGRQWTPSGRQWTPLWSSVDPPGGRQWHSLVVVSRVVSGACTWGSKTCSVTHRVCVCVCVRDGLALAP